MTPRLNHRKSRNGCRRCKQRKVKCDETRPACFKCQRHQASCNYEALPPRQPGTSILQQLTPPSDSNDTASEVKLDLIYDSGQQAVPEGEERRLLEMQLLNRYTTVVIHTFPGAIYPKILQVWTGFVVHEAFKYPFLLNAILAIAALHLWKEPRPPYSTLNPDSEWVESYVPELDSLPIVTAKSYAEVHRSYLDSCIQQYREALTNITKEKSPALFFAGVLLSYQVYALDDNESGLNAKAEYDLPHQWLRMMHGIRQTTDTLLPFLMESKAWHTIVLEGGTPDFRNKKKLFDPALRYPFRHVLNWAEYPEPGLTTEMKTMYEDVTAYLGGIYKGIQVNEGLRPLYRRILAMPMIVAERFITVLEQRRPRALVLMAYYSAMAIVLDDHWVFRGMAKKEVPGLLSLIPDDFSWAKRWPTEMVHSRGITILRPDDIG